MNRMSIVHRANVPSLTNSRTLGYIKTPMIADEETFLLERLPN